MTDIEQQNDMCVRHNNICGELTEIFRRKNQDYGDSFHKSYEEFGLTMAAIRLGDKLNRFKTLIKAESEVKDESIRDTLTDLANYAIMTVMELDRAKPEEERRFRILCENCGLSDIYEINEIDLDSEARIAKTVCHECGAKIKAEVLHSA